MTVETIRFRNIVSELPQASAFAPRPDQQRGSLKTKREPADPGDRLAKPDWICVKAAIHTGRFRETKDIVRAQQLVGLGETDDEILQVLRALRAQRVDMLTIGQYLQPSGGHMPVRRYVDPDSFKRYADAACAMGFVHAASGPLVRISCHADQQAHAAGVF